jgi:hypothetical protein
VSQEQAIVGETPNLAARLQGVAEPNKVVIAESTRKLTGNLFELEDLEAKDLKGISGRVRAWAALRPSSAEGRFDALHAGGLTELVGREEELELLLQGNKPLSESIRQDIIERTDGIPLFVEEMTKAVLEAEGEGEAQDTAASVPSSAPRSRTLFANNVDSISRL